MFHLYDFFTNVYYVFLYFSNKTTLETKVIQRRESYYDVESVTFYLYFLVLMCYFYIYLLYYLFNY